MCQAMHHAPAKKKKPTKTPQQIADEKHGKSEANRLLGKRKTFYDSLEQTAATARSTATTPAEKKAKTEAIQRVQEIDKLASTNSTFKKQLGQRVRVPARKQKGAKFGSGKDEPLQTAETSSLLSQSAGLDANRPATFPINLGGTSQDVDLLRVQQNLRLPTDSIVFPDGSGHPGALKKTLKDKGFVTDSSPSFHKKRTQVGLKGSTNPRNQLGRTLLQNVHGTANHTQMQNINTGVDPMGLDLSDTTDQQTFITKQIAHRNKKKEDVMDFQAATTSPPGSPLYQPSNGLPSFPPLSPRIDPTTMQPLPAYVPNPYGTNLTFKSNDLV
jgi:hypothetical protein